MTHTVITGSGAYIPTVVQSNSDFDRHTFYDDQRRFLPQDISSIIGKFKNITGISERRYAPDAITSSDMAYEAAQLAIRDSGTDPETLDLIIVAHNFGNVIQGTVQSVAVPSLASLVKQRLGIRNPGGVAFDLLFGCPGWIQGVINAHAFFLAGLAQKALIIGTETLSRVIDQHDRDSMIFSDGAGAVVLERQDTAEGSAGILGFCVQTDALEEADYISMGASFHPDKPEDTSYMKMKGRKVYEYALKNVPLALKACLDKCQLPVEAVKKIFIHQANEKMDEAIVNRFYELYGIRESPADIMPMSIGWLGNSSVATIPTLFDLVKRGQLPQHSLTPGDVILFASVGAGMNINAICYRY